LPPLSPVFLGWPGRAVFSFPLSTRKEWKFFPLLEFLFHHLKKRTPLLFLPFCPIVARRWEGEEDLVSLTLILLSVYGRGGAQLEAIHGEGKALFISCDPLFDGGPDFFSGESREGKCTRDLSGLFYLVEGLRRKEMRENLLAEICVRDTRAWEKKSTFSFWIFLITYWGGHKPKRFPFPCFPS